jgi:hypothetical protein
MTCTLMMNSMRKNAHKVFFMKILLKSIEIWNTWTNLLEYDQFMSSWAVIQLRLASTCVRVIICILMTNPMRKMTYKVFLMKLLLKSNQHMKYLDKFDRIWQIYDILPTCTASISFYMYFRVTIWTLMTNPMRKMTYKVFLYIFIYIHISNHIIHYMYIYIHKVFNNTLFLLITC